MKNSGMMQDGVLLSYEATEAGYSIYWGEEKKPRVMQSMEELPYPEWSAEENAVFHIRRLCGLDEEIPEKAEQTEAEEMKQTLSELTAGQKELEAMLIDTALSAEYAACLMEANLEM